MFGAKHNFTMLRKKAQHKLSKPCWTQERTKKQRINMAERHWTQVQNLELAGHKGLLDTYRRTIKSISSMSDSAKLKECHLNLPIRKALSWS